ncbi:MAG: HNH endonuclease, partial [Bacteroidota bacterium]
FFEGIIEYVSYSKILITELEVPKGSYDSHNEPEEYNDWKVHSVGSLAGIYDTGLEEIRDLAELMKLAESMFDEKFWNQVLQSLKNFNIADFAQSQLDQIEEFKNDLLGENGKPMQYYRGVYTAIKTIKTAVTIYKSLGKKFLDTFNPDCSDPDLSVTIVDNVDSHINGILPDGLHRSDAFTNLQKADKDRLIEDIASTDNNVLGAELANNPRLVNSWKVLDDAGSDVAKNVDLLKKIDEGGFDLDKVGDLYKNQKAPAGFKGKVDFEATKNIDGVDVTIKYDKEGFPDFRDHSLGEGFSVNSNTLNGTVDDFKAANTTLTNKIGADNIRVLNESGSPVLIKVDGKFEGPFTWHHHQDGKTLMPVKQSVHSSFSHSGGRAVIDRGLQGLFESPY